MRLNISWVCIAAWAQVDVREMFSGENCVSTLLVFAREEEKTWYPILVLDIVRGPGLEVASLDILPAAAVGMHR